MKKRLSLFSAIAGTLLCIELMIPGISSGEMLGSDAPDFTLADSKGNPFKLSQNLDKYVVLVYMQAYCHTCREDVPLINQIYSEYPNIHVIGILIGNDEVEASEFKKAFHTQFLILPDPKKKVLRKYAISTVPLIDVIDKTGTIRFRGKLDSLTEFKDILDGILKMKEVIGANLWNRPPLFSLKTSEGRNFDFHDMWAKKTVLLTFFSLKNEEALTPFIEIMKTIYAKYRHEYLEIVRIAINATNEEVNAFKRRYYINFPILVDKEGKVAQLYRVKNTPHSLVINKSGKIRFVSGPVSVMNVEAIVGKIKTYFREELRPEELETYLKQVAPEVEHFEKFAFENHVLYYGQTPENERVFVREIFKDILCDICTNIHFVYSFDSNGKVKNIVMIENIDLYGIPIEGKSFLQQIVTNFEQKGPLRLKRTINGITGATQSSKLILEGVNETLNVLEALKKHQQVVRDILK